MNQTIIQQEYGFLGDMIHVNVCSVGVPPMRTQRASADFMTQYLPMVYDSCHVGFGWLRSKVREQLAWLIHAEASEIAFTKNTTDGTSTLAWGYPMGPEDNVVVADLENTSNLYPWLHAAKVRGFQVKLIKTDGRSLTVRQYLDAMDAHTKVVAVSAVQAGTGLRIDLQKLGKICRERGILLAVDAIQALGRLNLDVQECCIDYLSCGGFKGLVSGFGIGFTYCRKELLSHIIPVCVSDNNTVEEVDPPQVYSDSVSMNFLDTAERFEGGSPNTPGVMLLHSSLSLMQELGKENIHNHVLALETELRQKLQGSGLDVLPSGELPSGMVVAYYSEQSYEQAEAILQQYDIRMTHRAGYLRLSIAMHNTPDQTELVAKALCTIGAISN